MLRCPVCNGNQYGKVAPGQFYCWNCFIEFKDDQHVYDVTEDGALTLRGKEA